MSKLTSYSRIIQHGVADPSAIATIPINNDHTSGLWLDTDIYAREIFINTITGHMDYRVGNDRIISPIITSGSTKTKVLVKEIGNWDMRNPPPVISISELNPQKKILTIDAVISDDLQQFYRNINYEDLNFPVDIATYISYSPTASLDIVPVTFPGILNYFYDLANSNTDYIDNTINRGYIIIEYID